jgi:arylsulfatase
MKIHFSIILFFAIQLSFAAENKPNILVIMADDLGFSDLGCYGSEIDTPNLDKLAAGGLRMSQFYNTAKCHSSRISLLTGRWCIQAGDTSLKKAVTIPEVLTPAGYSTAMTGKWHLDKEPTDFGFQKYFGHLSGACNYYNGDHTFRLNGKNWEVPKENFYTTIANVDYGIKFISEAREGKKPWFLYIAFNAPHAPLQPLKQDYEKYQNRYTCGWDKINAARFKKQKEVGLIPDNLKISQRPDHIPAWESLTPELKTWESRRMAAYGALIDRLDQEIGRLIRDIETASELENTLIVFVSDNGACPYDRNSVGMDKEPYDRNSAWSDSTGWAWARNTPFRYYKQNQFEGGISSPAIFHWPAGIKAKKGSVSDSPTHLVDLLPTLAEIGGAEIPNSFPGREPTPLAGTSINTILAGEKMTRRPPIHLLFGIDRGLRVGDWKIISLRNQPWELYNMATDRSEMHNLAVSQPERITEMVTQWNQITEETMGIKPKPVATQYVNKKDKEYSDYSGNHGPITSPQMLRKLMK